MSEPGLLTQPASGKNEKGRPAFSEEQYRNWLEEMRPHLEFGCSLYRATMKAAIEPHYDVILIKYKTGDWFSKKIDAYRSMPGENVNEALTRLTKKITDKVKADEHVTKDDFDILKFMGERHRTAQPFFVSRTENADVSEKPVGKVLDVLETDYDDLADNASQTIPGDRPEAQKQVVETQSPVQNPGQEGQPANISPEPGTAPASN